MYKCKKCGGFITKFDVCFGEDLLNDYRVEDSHCYRCQIGEDGLEAFKKAKSFKRDLKIYSIILVTIIIAVGCCFLAVTLNEDMIISVLRPIGITLDTSVAHEIVNAFIEGILPILLVMCIVVFCACDYQIIHQWRREWKGGYTGGSHYESKIDSYGTITTKKVDDYVMSSDNFEMQALKFITFPLWFIFHFVYVLIQSVVYLKIKIPAKAIRAYKFASKQVPKYSVTSKEIAQHKMIVEKHKKKSEKIIKRNSVLGQDEVNRHLAKIGVPVKYTILNKKLCICVEENQHYGYYSRDKRYIRFILSKRSDGEIKYNTLFGTYDEMYPIYGIDESLNTWKVFGISSSALNELPELTSQLMLIKKENSKIVKFDTYM